MITLVLAYSESIPNRNADTGCRSHKPTLGKQANKTFWEDLIDNFPSI